MAVECRQAIRLIDQLLGAATTEQVEQGVPIMRVDGVAKGYLSIAMRFIEDSSTHLPESINDNRIINLVDVLQL